MTNPTDIVARLRELASGWRKLRSLSRHAASRPPRNLDIVLDEAAALIERLVREADEARATATQQQAIIDRLPKTADGVVIPADGEAMYVFWLDGNVIVQGAAALEINLLFPDPNNPGVLFTPNDGIGSCYSTKEAAEAARVGKE